jgi:hypothetical protein
MATISEIADVIEIQAWASSRAETGSSLKALLQAAQDDVTEEDAESLAQFVMDEFASREQMLEEAYPFAYDGYKLELKHPDPHYSTYLFCLALSMLPPDEIESAQRDRQFEAIVTQAAKEFFAAEGIRIGAPWRSEEFPTYGHLLDRVVDMIPDLGEKLTETAPGGGDGGWDVLIVKGFKDNCFPKLVALGNCATGKNDWKKKGFETSDSWFWEFFSHKPHNVYLTFFAVPFVMDSDMRIKKHHATRLTFDRFRICEFAPHSGQDAAEWLSSKREQFMTIPII